MVLQELPECVLRLGRRGKAGSTPVLWPLKGLRQDNPGFEVSLGLKMTVCQQISQRQVRVCTL